MFIKQVLTPSDILLSTLLSNVIAHVIEWFYFPSNDGLRKKSRIVHLRSEIFI